MSGVLLFTRNKMTARLFRTLFAENLIRKEYVALVKVRATTVLSYHACLVTMCVCMHA